ncbi:conserved hypothetical protein (plasmid) [Trichormus variabilis ATCC 29413]|uniref:Uncharacterized protein n=2 Tax=Anabaena variabilis TaxID=264691 RepID=Q3M2Q1_TRIV2|nr:MULTISPECIES: hypothetical protein [Nostocaceae]ABA24735.1 conserved hypothetical protein [Trichormus variabilis ATCC 29413]MBC1217880.1 hypothetical protein [Trichormus variabilis ARAD]MBC1259204.1 hypothetical protein [Trichormus variabilis V5]MBC1270756.1 hypothetical protein [Trichormus variabilis FSR]MBC1305658.1 hypothetical protein [Trichormus variabilis N2B]
MKNLLIGISCAIAVALVPISTIAAPVVRTIRQQEASGTTAKLQTINVWNGHGVAISFYETGETIKKVWLDDPSQILIDTDGCLEGLDLNCPNPGAGLIHLRRIKRVNIPGLPQTLTTLLTVVTQSSSGERKTYSFRLATSNGTPKYSQVVITSADPIVAQKPQFSSLIQTQKTINQIRGGMAIAIKNGQMNYQDTLHQRLQKFVGYLQEGDDISTAADKASVSQELVNKLMALGNSSNNLTQGNGL